MYTRFSLHINVKNSNIWLKNMPLLHVLKNKTEKIYFYLPMLFRHFVYLYFTKLLVKRS